MQCPLQLWIYQLLSGDQAGGGGWSKLCVSGLKGAYSLHSKRSTLEDKGRVLAIIL
jgi:hypothetical protein